jgi:hypothetical protein
MGEGNENLIYTFPWDFIDLQHAIKSYDMGPSRFTSRRREGVLRNFIALKIHRLGLVLTRDLWIQWQAH